MSYHDLHIALADQQQWPGFGTAPTTDTATVDYLAHIRDTVPVQDSSRSFSPFVHDSLRIAYEKKSVQDTTKTVAPRFTVRPSVFAPQIKKEAILTGRERPVTHNDWITGIILLGLLLLTWMVNLYNRRLLQTFKAVVSSRHLNQYNRDTNVANQRINIFLNLLFTFSVSLLIFVVGRSYLNPASLPVKTWYLIGGIIAGVTLFWALKIWMIRLFGNVFRKPEVATDLILNKKLFNYITGLLLFPAIILMYYLKADNLLVASAVILLAAFIMQTIRAGRIVSKVKGIPLFYFFLYFCTLEILPILVLVKLIFFNEYQILARISAVMG